MGKTLALSPDGARRLAKTVRQAERTPRRAYNPPPKAPRNSSPAWYALTTGVISAANLATSTFGMGTAALQVVSRNYSTNVATFAALGTPDVTVYTDSSVSIPSGTLVQTKVIGGLLFIDVVHC